MPLSAMEKKRRSRARKPTAYHDREREESRKRMAMSRARTRAQKRASILRSILNEMEQKAVEARADEEKQRLIREWFNRNRIRFDPRVVKDDKILQAFITKRELCAIELQVAEFEITRADEFYQIMKKNITKNNKIDSPERKLNNQIDRFSEKEMAPSVIYGNEVPETLRVEQEDFAKPAHSGKSCIGSLSERREDELLAAEAMAIMQHTQGAGRQIHPSDENN